MKGIIKEVLSSEISKKHLDSLKKIYRDNPKVLDDILNDRIAAKNDLIPDLDKDTGKKVEFNLSFLNRFIKRNFNYSFPESSPLYKFLELLAPYRTEVYQLIRENGFYSFNEAFVFNLKTLLKNFDVLENDIKFITKFKNTPIFLDRNKNMGLIPCLQSFDSLFDKHGDLGLFNESNQRNYGDVQNFLEKNGLDGEKEFHKYMLLYKQSKTLDLKKTIRNESLIYVTEITKLLQDINGMPIKFKISEDPEDMLNMSISPFFDSCQNINSGGHNYRLLANVYDPNVKIAYLYVDKPYKSCGIQTRETMLARCLVRVADDKIFHDAVYSSGETYFEKIIHDEMNSLGIGFIGDTTNKYRTEITTDVLNTPYMDTQPNNEKWIVKINKKLFQKNLTYITEKFGVSEKDIYLYFYDSRIFIFREKNKKVFYSFDTDNFSGKHTLKEISGRKKAVMDIIEKSLLKPLISRNTLSEKTIDLFDGTKIGRTLIKKYPLENLSYKSADKKIRFFGNEIEYDEYKSFLMSLDKSHDEESNGGFFDVYPKMADPYKYYKIDMYWHLGLLLDVIGHEKFYGLVVKKMFDFQRYVENYENIYELMTMYENVEFNLFINRRYDSNIDPIEYFYSLKRHPHRFINFLYELKTLGRTYSMDWHMISSMYENAETMFKFTYIISKFKERFEFNNVENLSLLNMWFFGVNERITIDKLPKDFINKMEGWIDKINNDDNFEKTLSEEYKLLLKHYKLLKTR